ncbi:unnamed protein product [Rotaria sp. Silwood1]|nr:unnamed protein product [Rotaria sp. Silwood1]
MAHILAEADVILDGYRPGCMERLGFGRQAVHEMALKRGKGIVYARENCYGWAGPWSLRSGWQQISDCVTGVAWLQGKFLGLNEPVLPLLPNSDYQTGIVGAIAIVQALHKRAHQGGSYNVDVSLNQFNICLILIFITSCHTSSSDCDIHSNQDDTPFNIKVQQSPLILIGTSLNKNIDINIPNLFNVTFLVRCILKGPPTQRIIRIVQAGSLLGRRSCQRFDVNREYIAFLEPFFDGTYRPVDLDEISYNNQINLLLEKTCGLSRMYPFTELNDTEARLTNKCPSAVSIDCPLETSTTSITTTISTVLSTTTTTKDSIMFGKSTIDFAALSLLLAEHQRQNLNLTFLQGQNHKSLFSDDVARKNQANRFSFMIIISLIQIIFSSILHLFL